MVTPATYILVGFSSLLLVLTDIHASPDNKKSSGFSIDFGCSNPTEPDTLTLLFAGDIMGHDSQIAAAKTDISYNYDTCFYYLRPYIKDADISVANLEVTFAGSPHTGYPRFSSPDELATAIKKAGFDVMITANNHSLDRRKKGLERTIDILNQESLLHTGTFKTENERAKDYPLQIEKNNFRISLLNYTYGTNGIPVEKPNIVNLIDREQMKRDIEKAKSLKSDFIIVTLHWGSEYQRNENQSQRELAEFLVHQGVDAIIGTHPHVVQPLTVFIADSSETIVSYSLGNFISNQRKRYTDGGIMLYLQLIKEKNVRSASYRYLPVWVYKNTDPGGNTNFLLIPSNQNEEYYKSLGMDTESRNKMKIFQNDTENHLEGIIQLSREYHHQQESDHNIHKQ